MSYVTNKFLQPHSTLRLNAHRPKIPYNTQMDPYLDRPGLYQITIMGDFQLDKSLLTALIYQSATCLGCITRITIHKFLKSIKFMYFNWYMNLIY
jgi:hypothetical protein